MNQYIPSIPPIPPMPPIPPIPPIPPGPAGFSSFLSTIMHSVVDIRPLTEAASSRATLTTFFGSMIPASIKLTNSPFAASNPNDLSVLERILSTMLTPSKPALSAIALQGKEIALLMILIPKSCSEFFPFNVYKTFEAYKRAQPPPITIPYSIAARVAQIAS